MQTRYCITTNDNPYNPFTQFYEWDAYDRLKGYNSSEYLARIAKVSDQMTDDENNKEIERAIDEIIKYDPFNIYKKVEEPADNRGRGH